MPSWRLATCWPRAAWRRTRKWQPWPPRRQPETPAEAPAAIAWLPLALAAHAWQRGYSVYQLDPATPPAQDSPAGQLTRRAATFVRRQVQRSATERDKAVREIRPPPAAHAGGQSLESLAANQPQEAILPYYRPPVPVRYPEVARDTIEVEPERCPAAGGSDPRRTAGHFRRGTGAAAGDAHGHAPAAH